MIKVSNFKTSNGNKVANQFLLESANKRVFQSYTSVIVSVDKETGQVTLDEKSWDCSTTTGKYRNQFLAETKKETLAKIKSGEYLLGDLNA